MNTEELEDAIRAELRAEAGQAPTSAATRTAVLAATEGRPMEQPRLTCAAGRCRCWPRRWCCW